MIRGGWYFASRLGGLYPPPPLGGVKISLTDQRFSIQTVDLSSYITGCGTQGQGFAISQGLSHE